MEETALINNSVLTDKVMNKIAIIAEKDLKKKIRYILPIISLLLILMSLAFHTALERLVDKGVIAVIGDFEYGEDILWPHVLQSIHLIWSESEKTVLLSISVLVTATTVVITRSNITSFPTRLKEIKKFKLH